MASQRSLVVDRTFKQLDDLNELVDRYTAREQTILETLKYLMATLNGLEGWAVFAIFPSDNINDGKTYTACVEQRFQYCSRLLGYFSDAVNRRDRESQNSASPRTSSRDCSPRDSVTSSLDPSPRSARQYSSSDGSLRQQISLISKKYIDEGVAVHRAVVEYLRRCHQELLMVLQWGLSSVEQLQLIIDDAMAEMLVFTVKSRMWRLLSTIGDFEEAARKVEQTMSQDDVEKTGTLPPSDQNENNLPERLSSSISLKDTADYNSTSGNDLKDSGFVADRTTSPPSSRRSTTDRLPANVSSSSSGGVITPATLGGSTDDWRSLYLNNWVFDSSRDRDIGSRRALDDVDEDALMTARSEGSGTPEPPTSPHPLGRIRHPKIGQLRDRLHRSISTTPGGLLAAVMEDAGGGDGGKSLQASWNISSA